MSLTVTRLRATRGRPIAKIGVAISGGGHRATVWGWGALLALVDMGVNADVVSIASVSGGSIASGVVANAGDYAGMSTSAFEDALRSGATGGRP